MMVGYHLQIVVKMKQISRRSALKGIAAGTLSLTFAGIASAGDKTRYIVAGRGKRLAGRIEKAGFDIVNELADGDVLIVTGPEASLGELEDVRGVSKVIPDFKIELEEPVQEEPLEDADTDSEPAFWNLQWDKHVTDVDDAHDIATGDGSTIAILDTGIDHTHPDLSNVNEDLSVAVYGGELHDHTGDFYGHGTHVAGIAAATGEVGVIGTAPDAELVSVRVFTTEDEEQDSFWSDLLLAIEYAADEAEADSANMSIGTINTLDGPVNAGGIRGVTEPVMQYATRQGTLVVGSAGNHGTSLQEGGLWTLPNSLAGVMSTSATGPNDKLVFYSNWGTNEIDIGAPGGGYETLAKTLTADWDGDGDCEYPKDVDDDGEDEYLDHPCVEWPFPTNLVLSTVPPELYGASYAYFAGTSMAAPQVAGTAALVREEDPNASAKQVEKAIKQGADLVTGRDDPDLGAGRLNANGALDG